MKCNNCGNEIKQGYKFCTKCGKEVVIEQDIESKEVQRNKYIIERQISITMAITVCTLPIIIFISAIQTVGLFNIGTIICGLITVGFFLRTVITNFKFTCPNCNEYITLDSRRLTMVNQNKATCRCPKCGKELLFNTNEKTVNINKVIDNNNNNNSSGTGEIEKLYNLKSKGIITEEEFETKKQEILKKL